MFEDFIDTEVLFSPRFIIPVIIAAIALIWVLKSWSGRVPGIKGYAIIGGIMIVVWSYYRAAKSIDEDG